MQANLLLGLRRAGASDTPDSHGNDTGTLSPTEDWWVWGIAPGDNAEPGQPNRERSDIAWTVYAPIGDYVPTEHDVVIVDQDEYAIDGRPEDWTRGPFGPGNAGLVVKLKRMEG